MRCEERRGVAEVQRETKASAGDRLSYVAGEPRCMLAALLLPDLQRNLLLSNRDGPRSPRFIDSHTHSFARVITDDTCPGPGLFTYFSSFCPGPSSTFENMGATYRGPTAPRNLDATTNLRKASEAGRLTTPALHISTRGSQHKLSLHRGAHFPFGGGRSIVSFRLFSAVS